MNNIKRTLLSAILIGGLNFSTSVNAADPTPDTASPITRTIDASQYFRHFPELVAYRNTSIQKAPAPALLDLSEREYGKAKNTKCWLNLDEMWDYRTRKFDFNYQIGVHKYDDVPEKHLETWGSVVETNVPFQDYLRACSRHSDEIMLTIRRYERDILDGKLGVTMDDWKTIFKAAVKESRKVCPNLRYIEVCNEYGCKGFIGCTTEEYYPFYQLGYQAVNEVNEELNLTGDDRILVGGPVVTGGIVKKLDEFMQCYAQDPSPDKRLDFLSWHEYHNNYAATAYREEQVRDMLASHGLPTNLPMYMTEHDPYHPPAGKREYNLINAAGLVKSLYFTNWYSPTIKIMPWVQYHVREIQTRFMWFDGPNEPDTKIEELHMFPAGCSMKLLTMHNDWEIAVDNDVLNDDIVLASVQNDGLVVQSVNYGPTRDVRLRIYKLPQVLTALGNQKLRVVKYLIDDDHSNRVNNPDHTGGIEQIEEGSLQPVDGTITLEHPALQKNGIVFWKLTAPTPGAPLSSPVPAPSSTTTMDTVPFRADEAMKRSEATAGAKIERVNSTLRVQLTPCKDRAGVTFLPTADAWDMSNFDSIEAHVKNTGKRSLNIHLAVDNRGADRTKRSRCHIESVNIPAGQEQTLRIQLADLPRWRFDRGNVTRISLYVYHPNAEYTYEVTSLTAGNTSDGEQK